MTNQLTITTFKETLGKLIDKKDLHLPSTVDPEQFRNAAIIAFQDNDKLRDCSPESVFRSVRQLAGMGLVPDNREAAIVPFYDGQSKSFKASAQPMVHGLVKVARNSGKITTLWSEVVYDGEILHISIENGERRWDHLNEDGTMLNAMARGGDVIGAYAVAKLSDGTIEFLSMTFEDIEKRRKASPNQKRYEKGKKPVAMDDPAGIWADWYEEMAKKTVIRALCKMLPMSSEDFERIKRDPTFQEVEEPKDVTPPETTQERLQRIARERKEEDAAQVDDGNMIDGTVTEPDFSDMQGGFDDAARELEAADENQDD